jgi:hypothetical protein
MSQGMIVEPVFLSQFSNRTHTIEAGALVKTKHRLLRKYVPLFSKRLNFIQSTKMIPLFP